MSDYQYLILKKRVPTKVGKKSLRGREIYLSENLSSQKVEGV
jgi:hypothetical protein